MTASGWVLFAGFIIAAVAVTWLFTVAVLDPLIFKPRMDRIDAEIRRLTPPTGTDAGHETSGEWDPPASVRDDGEAWEEAGHETSGGDRD